MISPSHESPLQQQLRDCEPRIRQMPNGDDVFQAVCLRCLSHASTRDWSKDQHGFIRRIARNLVIDNSRRESVRQAVSIHSTAEAKSNDDGPAEAVAKREGASILRNRIDLLPPRQREVIAAQYVEGLNPCDIAKALQIPAETVKSRRKRGLARLRRDPALHSYSDGQF